MKYTTLVIVLMALIMSCKTTTETVWVNAYKADCEGVAPMECLQIERGDELTGDWEYFYDSIEGFDFEEGMYQKIKVEVSKVDNPPADASNLNYKLVEVLEERTSNIMMINNNWALETLNEKQASDFSGKQPTLELAKKEMKFYGTTGCNNYNGGIEKLTENELTFGMAATTRMACKPGTAEQPFLAMLDQVTNYKIEESTLHLMDSSGNTLATFSKS